MSRTTIDDVLECVVCLDDVENAHLCPLCSKVACLQCWEQIVPRHCPNCRGNLTDLKLIKCYWIADLGNCVKELKLASEQEKTKKAQLENELVTIRTQLQNTPGPSGNSSAPKKRSAAQRQPNQPNLMKPKVKNANKPAPASTASKQFIPPLMGREKKPRELGGLTFQPETEVVSAEERVSWLNGSGTRWSLEELFGWGRVCNRDMDLSAEAYWFCDEQILDNISLAKTIFDELDGMDLAKVRSRANPFEKVKGVFSINRPAMKMANIDAVFDFMFTNPKDTEGNNLLDDMKLLFFADLCGGPGGFAEYILWRKGWRAKGFGMTLKDEDDYKLEKFLEAPYDSFEAFYGSKGNGDVCDPTNIDSFCEYVMQTTGGGVHFVMANGGSCDEGRQKSEEMKSKRLFLCQCLVALRIVRRGGHFLMKLCNLLTPFCVGLVFLMHSCFQRIAIHKPNTSLPTIAERYLICGFKHDDDHCNAVVEFLTRINHRLIDIEGTDADVAYLVPRELITEQGSEFLKYVKHSNDILGLLQLNALLKIDAFADDASLIDTRQNELKRECLKLYAIEEKPRTVPVQTDPTAVIEDAFKIEINHVGMTLFYSQGGRKVLRLNSQEQWVPLPELTEIALPRDTLLWGQLVDFIEPNTNDKRCILHIRDAVRLAGEDVTTKTLDTRKKLCEIFAKAIKRTGNWVTSEWPLSRPAPNVSTLERFSYWV